MQFVVAMDLLGTVVLPVAIVLTYILIVGMALNPPRLFEEAIPLILLVSVIGLPAVLILLTTRKIVYVFSMLIYLLALPGERPRRRFLRGGGSCVMKIGFRFSRVGLANARCLFVLCWIGFADDVCL